MKKRIVIKLANNGMKCRKDTEMKATHKWGKMLANAFRDIAKSYEVES